MVSDAIEVLGWTLLHFVWQGAVVGVLAAMLLATLRRRSANTRYVTAVAALGLMLLLPLVTIAWVERTTSSLGEISPIVVTKSTIELPRSRENGKLALDEPPITVERISIDFENQPPPAATPLIPVSETGQTLLEELSSKRSAFNAESFLKPLIPWTVAAWLIGVGMLSLRLFGGWLRVQRLRHRATQPASESWQALLCRLAERLRVTRPVQLVESALVEVPTVIGWLSPMILLPATAMTGLTTEQLEALLAHELAHVRRHDYLINLLQTVVETLLFYHPAVWWVSHLIRVEREHCCDDLAVRVCGDRLSYAQALVAMEELRAPKLGLAMSVRGGDLLSRVTRLVVPIDEQRRPSGWIAGLIALILLTVAGALGAGLLTPPDKPTAGLPNDTPPASTNANDTNEETSGPDQRRGQETRAERDDPEKRVIARVNGVAVHEADVTSRYSSQLALVQTRVTPEEFRKQVDDLIRRDLPAVIERKLLVAEAMKLFDAQQRQAAEEFIKRNLAEQVVAMMKDSGVTNREELQNWLRQRGTSLERFESEFREKLYAQQFLAKKLESAKTPEETEKLRSQLLLQLWQRAEVKSAYLPHRGEIRWVDRPNQRVWINLGEADGIKRGSVFRVVSIPPNNAPAQPVVIKGKIAVIRLLDAHTSEAQILESDNDGPAKGNEVIPADFPDPKANGVDLRLLFPLRKPDEDKGRFVGRVRLKTEKALPDLEKLVMPAGKVLDESLVFSKGGGLANVFVYLRKPTFPVEPATEAELAKPFVLIAEDGKFWPRAALVRIGRPVIFENGAAEPMNFVTQPFRNAPFNVLVKPEDRFKAPAYEKSESFPFAVKCNIKPWMQAHLLPLDHPFAAVTDDDGRFTINGLPPGEHEFRVWHERVGYLEKSLKITIKPDEVATSELEYAPDRLKLTEADVLAWGNRLINAKWVPQAIVLPPLPAGLQQKKENDALLTIPPGKHRLLETEQRIHSVSGFDPGILTITAVSPKQVQCRGGSEGRTTFIVTDETGQTFQVAVEVTSDDPDEGDQTLTTPLKLKAAKPGAGRTNSDKDQNKNDKTNGDLRSDEAAGSGDPRRAQGDLERSVHDAQRAAEVAKAEYEKMLESNRRVPGAVPPQEVERAMRIYEMAHQVFVNAQLQAEIDRVAIARAAIERGTAFLKSQQQENGTWQGQPVDGVTALCAAALLQAGVKPDDPVMQKALAHLRKVEPTFSYTVALQTMVFCSASPKEDAELIRRNVAWLEEAQVTDGKSRGSWGYVVNPNGRGDGSCSWFAILGLDAAKRAGFEVKEETWKRVSDYWLTNQKAYGGWGYTTETGISPIMTLAGIAGLATANRHLPPTDETKTREAAIRKPAKYLESMVPGLSLVGSFYGRHSLERAGHLSGLKEFGKLEWKSDATKRLLELQQANGSWKGNTQTESDLIATSFALMCLTGQPEPPRERQLRIERRDPGKSIQMSSSRIENSNPPRQRTEISGGVRIEVIESDGSKHQIEADRVEIESDAPDDESFEMGGKPGVIRLQWFGKVVIYSNRAGELVNLATDGLWLNLSKKDSRIELLLPEKAQNQLPK